MAKIYHTLMVREPGAEWFPDFGDYDRKVVMQEIVDRKESISHAKGTRYKVVSHFDNMNQLDVARTMRPFD